MLLFGLSACEGRAPMSSIQSDVEFVLRTVEERDIHFIQFWFTDVLGNLKSFAATPGELEDAMV